MSGKSPIQWTEATWNPVVGCKRVSAGCDHCYAFELHDKRHIAWKRGRWPSAPAQYHKPFSQVQLLPERLQDPLHWRKPRRVFVNSMSDLFHDDVPDTFIMQVFAVMFIASGHKFQVLTKRPARMQRLLSDTTFQGGVDFYVARLAREHGWDACIAETDDWPLKNVWVGVSVENQAAADERIPLLLQTPAAVRFLSCEQLLGEVNLMDRYFSVTDRNGEPSGPRCDADGSPAIKWVIIGGESGSHARWMSLNWPRSLVEQCAEAGVACFVKQLGSVWASDDEWCRAHRDRHGGLMEAWPGDLQVR